MSQSTVENQDISQPQFKISKISQLQSEISQPQFKASTQIEIQSQEIAPEIRVDSDPDAENGTLYRLWHGTDLLGTFYHDLDGFWVSQPCNSDNRPRCNTALEAQLAIVISENAGLRRQLKRHEICPVFNVLTRASLEDRWESALQIPKKAIAFLSQAERFKKWITSVVMGATIAQPTTEPQPQLLPTSTEISEVIDLILGQTGLDSKLIAGAKGNAISRIHPQHAVTIEAAKALLSTPVESNLVRPKALAERLAETTGQKWTAMRINKLLLEQGFQIKNPDGKNPAYLPTEKGKEHSQLVFNTAKGHGKTIQSLQWHLSVLEALEAKLPCEFFPNWTYQGIDEHGIQILLRVDRELALQRFLGDYFLPCLEERGYSLRNLLQALGSATFDHNEKVAHYLWDAVASLDNTTTPSQSPY